jgi:hypothetical protein
MLKSVFISFLITSIAAANTINLGGLGDTPNGINKADPIDTADNTANTETAANTINTVNTKNTVNTVNTNTMNTDNAKTDTTILVTGSQPTGTVTPTATVVELITPETTTTPPGPTTIWWTPISTGILSNGQTTTIFGSLITTIGGDSDEHKNTDPTTATWLETVTIDGVVLTLTGTTVITPAKTPHLETITSDLSVFVVTINEPDMKNKTSQANRAYSVDHKWTKSLLIGAVVSISLIQLL